MRQSAQREVTDLLLPIPPSRLHSTMSRARRWLCHRKSLGHLKDSWHALSRAEALVSVRCNGGDIVSLQHPAGLSCPL